MVFSLLLLQFTDNKNNRKQYICLLHILRHYRTNQQFTLRLASIQKEVNSKQESQKTNYRYIQHDATKMVVNMQ